MEKKFGNNIASDKNGNRVYSVYFNYESDVSGEFTVLADTDQANI